MVCAMNSFKRTGRRSQSPNALGRFKTFRSLRTSLSFRGARSLTDVSVAGTGSPSATPDVLSLDAAVGASTKRAKARKERGLRPRSTTINICDASPTSHSASVNNSPGHNSLKAAARAKEVRRQRQLSDQGDPIMTDQGSAVEYVTDDHLPEYVRYTSVEELRASHEYNRYLALEKIKVWQSKVRSKSTPSPVSFQPGEFCGKGYDDYNRTPSQPDGVFEEERTPVPSPKKAVKTSTPIPPAGGRKQKPASVNSTVRDGGIVSVKKPPTRFYEHDVEIKPDSLGYGLNITGTAPVYVLYADRFGAGYKAGVRVGDFILNANGFDVLSCSHEEIAAIIMKNTDQAHLVILAKRECLQPHRPNVIGHPFGYTRLNGGQMNDSLIAPPAFDPFASIMTEESYLLSESAVRPGRLQLLSGSGEQSIASRGSGGEGGAVKPQRRQSTSSLLSQSAPVSPADRKDKLSLLTLSKTIDLS